MSLRHFNIGQSVEYRIGGVSQGPFVIVSVIAQPRHGIRYRIRSRDDDTSDAPAHYRRDLRQPGLRKVTFTDSTGGRTVMLHR